MSSKSVKKGVEQQQKKSVPRAQFTREPRRRARGGMTAKCRRSGEGRNSAPSPESPSPPLPSPPSSVRRCWRSGQRMRHARRALPTPWARSRRVRRSSGRGSEPQCEIIHGKEVGILKESASRARVPHIRFKERDEEEGQ